MFCSATTHVSSLAATASRRLDDVRHRATLPLEIREPLHALVASRLVERIRRVLEARDLRLERVGAAGRGTAVEVRQRDREILHLVRQRVGRTTDVWNARTLGGRHLLEQAQDFVAIRLRAPNAIAVLTRDANARRRRIHCRRGAAVRSDHSRDRAERDAARASPGADRD